MISNICRANFNGGRTARGNNRYQWDYGQILEISGIENLPDPFTAQFSNYPVLGTAKTAVGTGGSVEIPNEYFVSGQNIYCFIVLHTDEDDGRTVYIATIPVTKRPKPIDDPITPTQQSTIDTAIAALQAGVSRAEGFAGDAEEQAGIAQNAATTATEAATRAEGAVDAVEAAATRAETAADGAEASATAAGASATGAETAKTAAEAAKGAAETAAASAEQSATDAGNYAGLAEEAETAAAASATAAEASATAAAVSATQASGSASQAAQSASEASASATAAQTSATNAEAAKTGAETAQAAAETAQGKAEEAAANAEHSATTAEWYAERVERFLPTDTASGEIASFPDGADSVPMQSVIVSMEPIQDLHGYDHPWPVGGGKNLLPAQIDTIKSINSSGTWSDNVYTWDGVTFALSTTEDGYVTAVTVNGTATSNAFVRLDNSSGQDVWLLPDTKYIISGSPSGTDANECRLQINYNQKTGAISAAGVNVNFTTTSESITEQDCYIILLSGNTADNFVFKPMIRLASVTDATFAPYSNICPISGRTGANMWRTGRNLFDFTEFARQYPNNCVYDQSTGEFSISALIFMYNTGVAFDFNLDDGGYVSAEVKCGTASNVRIRVWYSDGTFTETSGVSDTSTFVRVYTTLRKKRITSIRLNWTTTGTLTLKNFYLTNVETATDYEPYQGETISVSWESEAGTVYGGTLDVVGGELVVDRAMVDLGSFHYTLSTEKYPRFRTENEKPENIKLQADVNIPVNGICEIFPVVAVAETYKGITGLSCQPNGDLRIYAPSYSDATAFKTAMSGVMFCYELAEPITYHLTPQEVRTLLGTNNVWSDAGDTAVTYKADVQLYIDKRISAVS